LPTEKELYTIKKLKTFKGMEGMGGFNLDLCRNGKKIAECINDDTGGDTMFYFINRDEEKIFDNYVKSLPPYEYDGETYSTDWNIYVENLVNAALEERLFKRLCKKYVCYELHGDKPGRYYRYGTGKNLKENYNSYVATLKKEHGEKIAVIYNEKYNIKG